MQQNRVSQVDTVYQPFANDGPAMARFLSGPPGGRTLPLTPPRLSDLVGGVYGPGASVASTGLNAGRAVIKTANARAAGETWDDLMEYYLVRPSILLSA